MMSSYSFHMSANVAPGKRAKSSNEDHLSAGGREGGREAMSNNEAAASSTERTIRHAAARTRE